MPESPAIAVFVLLALPGLLALGLYQSLTPTRTQQASTRVVLAITLSLISYLVLAVLHSWLSSRSSWYPDPTILLDASGENLRSVFSLEVIWVVTTACVVSTLIAIALVVQTNHELLHRVSRFMRITRRYGYDSHWDVVMHTKGMASWINVKFLDGDEYVGAIESYSDASDERSLLLGSVAKINPDKSREDWGDNGYLYIPNISEVRSMRIQVVLKESNNGEESRHQSSESERTTTQAHQGIGVAPSSSAGDRGSSE